ncbi:type VI secretion system protein ImpJ [Marinospirillum celere]|uniref:Type VI secretion system protein ImpJ n=1 Tax=Marinospirillum celere TaxID=1122252 RepID=A0A1I1HC37_9GAMM|nr:type VI secretion system baseplate subunit TssK [Marinospirillum celere]SFC18690.1 type VI secretion system protein ImpJ [Marinospirillum celere]
MTSKPIYWHQGLFLQPQHFQHLDSHHLSTQHALRQALGSYVWGVAASDQDKEALAAGKVSFRQLKVLFRDGTWFDFPGNADLEDLILDEENWPDSREPLDIYLVVSSAQKFQAVQTSNNSFQRQLPRYRLNEVPEQLPDYHQPGEEVETPLLTLYGKLVTRSQLNELSGVESLPLCQLIQQDEHVELNPDFLPPVLTMNALPELYLWLQNLRDELVSRATQLEDYKQSPTSYRNSDFNPKMMRYRLALHVLSRSTQGFSHLLDLKQVPPERVYLEARQLIAELSCFSVNANIRGEMPGAGLRLPDYDHLNLGHCFGRAKQLAMRLMNEIAIDSESLARFEIKDAGHYHLELPKTFLDHQQKLYLVLRTHQERAEWLEAFQRYSKLGTPSLVPAYQARALPGVEKRLLEVRPEGLPQRPNSTYFLLERHNEAWAAVEKEGLLELAWPDAPEDLSVELVATKG